VLARHHHVGDDEIPLALRHPAEQRGAAVRRLHVIAGAAQRVRQNRADRGVVVSDEDRFLCVHSVRLPMFASGFFALSLRLPRAFLFSISCFICISCCCLSGKLRRKTVLPGSLATSIRPPWSSTIFETMERPRPSPFGLVVKNGSKI